MGSGHRVAVNATHTERFIFPSGEMVDFTVVDAPTAGDGLLDTVGLEAN